jgi:hypothetical protein
MTRTPYPIRPRNKYGGAEDLTTDHGWTHCNLQIYGEHIPQVAQAFDSEDPFAALGYTEDATTRSIEKWYARPCELDDSYLISFECLGFPPIDFVNYMSQTYGLHIMCEYADPVKPKMHKHYANWHKPIPVYQPL